MVRWVEGLNPAAVVELGHTVEEIRRVATRLTHCGGEVPARVKASVWMNPGAQVRARLKARLRALLASI